MFKKSPEITILLDLKYSEWEYVSTMKKNESIHFLIVEDEVEVSDVVCLFLGGHFDATFTVAGSGKEAVEKLKTTSTPIHMVVSDYNMPNGNGAYLFEYLKEHHPEMPFLLVTSDSWHDHKEFHDSKSVGYVAKPFTDSLIVNEARRIMDVCKVPVHIEHQFVGISLQTLLNIRSVIHPLFIRLSDDKYVKFINSGVEITLEDFEKFKQKGIQNLFVERKHFAEFIHQFKKKVLGGMLFKGIHAKPHEALELTASVHDVVLGAVRAFGISNDTEELAKKNITFVRDLIQNQSELSSLVDWAKFTQQDYTCAHSILISYLTTEVANSLKLTTPHATDVLALAAFFHDISLDNHQIKNESRFIKALSLNSKINKNDLDTVKTHTEGSVAKLKEWLLCPEELIRVVHEHHEKPNGSGFPEGKNDLQIGELSTCFIVCEDLAQSFLELKDKSSVEDYFKSQSTIYTKGLFKQVYDHLLKKLLVGTNSSSAAS